MSWKVEYNATSERIDLAYSGIITGDDLRDSTTRVIGLSKENDCLRVLVDATNIEKVTSILDLYNLPDKQYVEEGMDPRIRLAVIQPESIEKRTNARFYENACRNRGWTVSLFSNQEESIEWLMSDDSTS